MPLSRRIPIVLACALAVPAFYARGEGGIPAEWLAIVRASLRTIGPQFGAGRMIRDYVERIYPPGVVAGAR